MDDDGPASEPGMTARPLHRMARWVGLSVVAAAILTALATLIAIASFESMEEASGDVNDRVIPALTSALKLSERSSALVYAATELNAARDIGELDGSRAKQHGLAASALATLDTLRSALPPDRHQRIATALEELLLTLGNLADAVAHRIALNARRDGIAAELSGTLERWNETIGALVYAARTAAPVNTRRAIRHADPSHFGTVTDAPPNPAPRALDRAVEEAFRQSAEDVEFALGIKADGNLLLASLKAALDQSDDGALLDTKVTLGRTAASIRDQSNRLASGDLARRNPILIERLHRMIEVAQTLAFGGQGVFALRRDELALARGLAGLTEEARSRALATQILVGQAVNRIEGDVAERRQAVLARIRLSRLQLIGLCVGGLALAGLVALIIYRAVARHETTLHRALIAVETASRSKSEFLANMSHELRTPLNAIIGFSEILKNEVYGPLGAAQYRQYASLIESSGEHLLSIITDILDISKIEAGRLELHPEPTDAAKVLESVIRLMEVRAAKGRVTLSASCDPRVPAVNADPIRLKQILLNLVSNAVKFTNPGGAVTLSVDLAPRPGTDSLTAAGGAVRFQVTDTGIGMSPEGLRTAIRPFGQIDTPLNRDHGGTGLGLPLVANLVRLSGGELFIDSAPGEGTTVAFTLPATLPATVPSPDPASDEAVREGRATSPLHSSVGT